MLKKSCIKQPFKRLVDPDFMNKLNKKDSALDERLKNVYVTSEDRFASNLLLSYFWTI